MKHPAPVWRRNCPNVVGKMFIHFTADSMHGLRQACQSIQNKGRETQKAQREETNAVHIRLDWRAGAGANAGRNQLSRRTSEAQE